MRTGTANLPLHGGKAPRWLFSRMVGLAREIASAVVWEYGRDELLLRLSDPFWFQALGCVLGFDWHSSGVTTTVCGALKEGIRGREHELGFFVAGGKGRVSRQTPAEIAAISEKFSLSRNPAELVYASRMSAKVDSSLLQDGFQIYHHCFLFTSEGRWAVVQQGMNEESRYARRYHWLGEKVSDFVCEPHQAVCCDTRGMLLNMAAQESGPNREISAVLSREDPAGLLSGLKKIKSLDLPPHHEVLARDLNPDSIGRILLKTYENQPQNYENLLGMEGVGPKTIRALALLSEVVHGAPASRRDPVRYSFAHGGKDGYPYPVNRGEYDRSIDILSKALKAAKVGHTEKLEAFRRLRVRP